jgi:hypothetical protein
MCDLQILLKKNTPQDIELPNFEHDNVPYMFMALFDDISENDYFKQMVQIFAWMKCRKTFKGDAPNLLYLDANPSKYKVLYVRMDLPVWVLSTLNTITEMMSALDLTKLSSNMSDIRDGDIILMSGMYSTVVDMINKAHSNDLFTFEKRDDVEGLANITLPMIASNITDDNVTFELVPYLKPLIPTGDITLSKKQVVNMEPYIRIYRE